MILFTQTDCQLSDTDRLLLLAARAREDALRDAADQPSRRCGRSWTMPIQRVVLCGVGWLRPTRRIAVAEAGRS